MDILTEHLKIPEEFDNNFIYQVFRIIFPPQHTQGQNRVTEESRVLRGKIASFYQNVYCPFVHPEEFSLLSDSPTGVSEVLKLASRQIFTSYVNIVTSNYLKFFELYVESTTTLEGSAVANYCRNILFDNNHPDYSSYSSFIPTSGFMTLDQSSMENQLKTYWRECFACMYRMQETVQKHYPDVTWKYNLFPLRVHTSPKHVLFDIEATKEMFAKGIRNETFTDPESAIGHQSNVPNVLGCIFDYDKVKKLGSGM
jgi:hypothetical protein